MINPYSVFKSHSEDEFNQLCLDVFKYQYEHIEVYREFADYLKREPGKVRHYLEIPFLPIEFFKSHKIIEKDKKEKIVFRSSGTTGMSRSKHLVSDIQLYEASFIKGFEHFYGPVKDYVILALLPSYIENGDSSLVYMADKLIQLSEQKESGFYLNNYDELIKQLHQLKTSSKKVILLGVSYALLDIAEKSPISFPELIVMETGGMKGRRKEMIREELHEYLKTGFAANKIHSEYGMTELLSQAYSKGEGVFESPPWMKILIRDVNDPLSWISNGKSGAVNIIDLANYHSLSFIATQDLGKISLNNRFEILGRFDHSDIRGCNLLIA